MCQPHEYCFNETFVKRIKMLSRYVMGIEGLNKYIGQYVINAYDYKKCI